MKTHTKIMVSLSLIINMLSMIFMRKILQSDYYYLFFAVQLLAVGYFFKVLFQQIKTDNPSPKSGKQ